VRDGTNTPTDSASPSGERRHVTALFADMVGFTATSERLGEEGTFALIQPPRGFGLKRLVDLPMAWPDQWRTLGFQAPAQA
jgi:hypothetical protein